MFRVGQRVECIEGFEWWGLIKKGDRVTISHIYTNPFWGDIVGLDFSDAAPPPKPYTGYNSRNFKPIVETETDISVFTKMLKPTKITEDA